MDESRPVSVEPLRKLPGRVAAVPAARCARRSTRSTPSPAPPTTSPTKATPRPSERLAELARLSRRRSPRRPPARPARARWPQVFEPLAARDRATPPARASCCTTCSTPSSRTCRDARYADRAALLDYCRRSANPVGRLLLHLYGVGDADALRPVRRDLHRAAAHQLLAGPGRRHCRAAASTCPRPTAAATASTRSTLLAAARHAGGARAWSPSRRLGARADADGAPLVHACRAAPAGSCGSWCRAACACSTNRRARRRDLAAQRPTLGRRDAPLIAWRALRMRARGRASAQPHEQRAAGTRR